MENVDQLMQMLEEFHECGESPSPRNESIAALNAQKEVLNTQIEARVKDIEAFILQNENLHCALLWDAAKTLQGTKFYDAFVALLQKHNIPPI